MLFNSAIFFVFLAVVLAGYYLFARRSQNAWLLVASYVFYGWWDWRFLFLLFATTAIAWATGLGMDCPFPRRRKACLVFSLVSNLGILGFFKYFDFFADSLAAAFAAFGLSADPPTLKIVLPVGISFYTFQALSYTVDVYRKDMPPTRSFLDFALYVSFFPQLVAGPIERATHLLHQFAGERRVTREALETGSFLILQGLFRKIVIADGAAGVVNAAFANASTAPAAELAAGMVLFALQIYGDFAGYSDIARGVARLMGFELMENFRQPYFSRSVTEFWRRWHISLSTWLRDYLYIPLGGNRKGPRRMYANLMATMLLGGLWHGANWTFVAWGGLHGAALCLHRFFLRRSGRKADAARPLRFADIPAVLATFLVVDAAWVFFRAPSFSVARAYFAGLFSLRGGLAAASPVLFAKVAFFAALAAAGDIPARLTGCQEGLLRAPWFVRGAVFAAMLLLLIVLRPLDDTPFLYFQF